MKELTRNSDLVEAGVDEFKKEPKKIKKEPKEVETKGKKK